MIINNCLHVPCRFRFSSVGLLFLSVIYLSSIKREPDNRDEITRSVVAKLGRIANCNATTRELCVCRISHEASSVARAP